MALALSFLSLLLFISPSWAQRVPYKEVPREVLKDDLARDAFRNGIEYFQRGDYAKAEENLKTIPELGGFLSLYTHWFMGQSLFNQKKWKEAIPHFKQVSDAKAASELKYQAQYFLAQISLSQEKWSEGEKQLARLERRWRRSIQYPEVLFHLTATELKMNRPAAACKWARKLFIKFPGHATVHHWGPDLYNQMVDGKKLACAPSNKDFQERVRSLQLSGESERARTELLALQAKAPEGNRMGLDMIMANFLVNEGLVDDALNLLVRYYPDRKGDFNYLTLLGKAAARAGEFQTAVGAYERAYKLSPRSKKGREALFQAAYLSYQFQDYDGAVRKFDQFIKQQPRSGLAQDAQWHLAWLKYLRGDYKGALERFEVVKKTIHRRRSSADELLRRISYWSSMAQLRLHKLPEAKAGFESIQQKYLFTYYGIAAQARLTSLKDITPASRLLSSAPPAPIAPSDVESAPAVLVAATEPASAQPVREEDESEEAIVQQSEEQDATDSETSREVEEGAEVADGAEAGEEEVIRPSDFKDPLLRSRIEIAQKLIELGLPDLARWELREVERRTRNSGYLKMLISAYESIGSYNRSASISELSFAKDRESLGLEGGRPLWVAMYPQAYKTGVQRAAKQSAISPEWIWSIMRTESQYKPDVVSPVGARGLMQLMPFTARNLNKLSGRGDFDVADLFKPEVNVALGAQYLSRLGQKFKGSLPLVAAAYNAGPHRVENWLMGFGHLEGDEFIEHIPFMETRNYVKKVVRSHTLYRRIYAKDQKPVEYLARGLGVPIPSRPSAKESWEAL